MRPMALLFIFRKHLGYEDIVGWRGGRLKWNGWEIAGIGKPSDVGAAIRIDCNIIASIVCAPAQVSAIGWCEV